MGRCKLTKDQSQGTDTTDDSCVPTKLISEMRKYMRKHYEGLAHGKYSLRANAKVRVRKYDDFCILCFSNAHYLHGVKGLRKRASAYRSSVRSLLGYSFIG
jgi:hypothetical protein